MEYYHDVPYLDMVRDILDNGVRKENRTGMDTFAVFSRQMRFKLYNGSIPLLTTKKMFTRGVIHEILWYLMGTGDATYLKEHQVRIWDEWMNKNNKLGPVYGAMWRAYPPPHQFSPIKKRDIEDTTTTTFITPLSKEVKDGKFKNHTFINYQGLQYQVLGVDGTSSNGNNKTMCTYAVQFIKSGWIKYGVSTRLVSKGKFSDQSLPSVYGVGILGNYDKKKESKTNKRLRRRWELMISRCYNKNDVAFETHGKVGVRVCNRWKILSNFIQDAKKLPNWFIYQNVDNCVLDKDYYGNSKIYHPDTCVWISRKHNNMYRKDAKPTILESQDNILFFPTEKSTADYLGCGTTVVKSRLLKKNNKPYKGYKINSFEDNKYVIRAPNTIDQIATTINLLRCTPTSRRLVISGWHPGLLPDETIHPKLNANLGFQALPPCHYTFQFYTRPLERQERMIEHGEGRFDATHKEMDRWGVPKYALSCMLNQRSCDTGLGVPFNIVQYSILTHMIAHVCNMIPEEFIWNGGDVHIYENHVDQLKEQLTRDPYPSPRLILNKDVKEIDDFKYDDFKIIGYKHHPLIRMEVSV